MEGGMVGNCLLGLGLGGWNCLGRMEWLAGFCGFWRDWEGGFVWGGRNGRELSAGLGIWRAELFWEGGFDSGGWLCLGRVVLACVFPGRACRCDVITLPVYINLAVFGLDC